MARAPILARTTYTGRVPMVLFVEGGLHYIRGNAAPYFALTYTAHRKGFPNQCYSGGAGHEEILKRFPRFADLAALHLCGPDGASNLSNAWYWYAGALGGLGERYHGSNDGSHSEEQSAAIFQNTVRVDAQTTAELISSHMSKSEFMAWCETQRERWQQEADACIAHHNLQVFGDPLPTEA
jgi:hypothetical protein